MGFQKNPMFELLISKIQKIREFWKPRDWIPVIENLGIEISRDLKKSWDWKS